MNTPSTLVSGRYRLIKMLGAGGMGVVWHAWDERLQRPVALKMLRTQPELTDEERQRATDRALREARITAGLHHPHAVTVFDVVEQDGQPCIVMQLIESTPLSVLLTEHGTLSPAETARIGAEVGSALAAAHKIKIVHRDVKPGNILITEDASALISDFGISHALGDTTITATGMIHGTPAYLAPEVARGLATSFASDVFSLGATLYAMLEGAPPFGSDNNAIALLHRVARGGYPAPKHAGPLAPLLAEMLDADPKRRPTMAAATATLSTIRDEPRSASTAAAARAVAPAPMLPAAREEPPPTVPAPPASDRTAPTVRVDPPTPQASATAETERLSEPSATAETERFAQPSAAAETERLAEPSAAAETERFAEPSATAETERFAERSVPVATATPEKGRSRRGGRALMVAGALAGVAIIVLVVALLLNQPSPAVDGAAQPSESPTSAAPADTETPAAESSVAPSAPAEQTQDPAPPPPTPEQRVADTVAGYYAMLPGDLDSAWPMMTADYQENHAGGRAAYESFWAAIDEVEIADVTAPAADRAQATLTYYFRDGRVVQEVTAYQLVEEGGTLKIAASDVLSSTQL
jgi:hypothetical protein